MQNGFFWIQLSWPASPSPSRFKLSHGPSVHLNIGSSKLLFSDELENTREISIPQAEPQEEKDKLLYVNWKSPPNVTRRVLFLFLQITSEISTASAIELSSSGTTPLSGMKILTTILCYSIFSHEVEPTEKWQITINGQWPLWFKKKKKKVWLQHWMLHFALLIMLAY